MKVNELTVKFVAL